MTELHWTEIDGVCTVWANARTPLQADLRFRAGRVDETLATGGQTHLIEHTVLSAISDPVRANNGYVGGAVCGLFTLGRPDEVVAFLDNVCRALASLPAERLDAEKQILAAESSGDPYSPIGRSLIWRYGAKGYGLMGFREYGYRRATLEALQAVVADRFTRGNAILCLSGPPPASVRLSLPDGPKRPVPPLESIQPVLPAWFVDDRCGGIVATATTPRNNASLLYRFIAAERLRKELREERALSYVTALAYEPLSADVGHLLLHADADEARRGELTGAFGEALAGLDEFSAEEFAAAQEQLCDMITGSLAPTGTDRAHLELERASWEWLLDRTYITPEDSAAEVRAATVDEVRDYSRAVRRSMLFGVPSGVEIQPWMGEKAPVSCVPPVEGHTVTPMDAPVERATLVHGPDGVSLRRPDGWHLTVRYASLAAALEFPDGGLHLFGLDGVGLAVEPTLWRNGTAVSHTIRTNVPAHLLVAQDARPADAIPKPSATAWQRLRATFARNRQ